MPKVSIVLPTYNGEKYIRESIDSVINQTFTDWELIIVNDCSKDSTPKIVEEYAKKDSRIRVIHNETNQKLPRSLNIGFREAKGDFFTWTSDDNLYLPNAIEKLQGYLVENPDIYLVCSDTDKVDANCNLVGKTIPFKDGVLGDGLGASFMYRKEVLKEVGEYNPEKFLIEDYDYWLRILFRYKKIGYINKSLYLYRIHDLSLSATRFNDVILQSMKLQRENIFNFFEYYKDHPKHLTRIYFDFKRNNFDISDIENKFLELVPELRYYESLDSDKKTIIYGAGKRGGEVLETLKDNVVFFADRDENKVGTYKNGVKIISIDEMLKKQDEFNIVVAIYYDIYDAVKDLLSKGLTKYSLL